MKNNIKILVLSTLLLFISCNKATKKQEKVNNIIEVKDSISADNSILKQEISLRHPSEFKDVLVYTVQIGAYKQPNSSLENKSNVISIERDSLIKYRLGNFETYKEATKFKNGILTSYPDAFIVPINKGVRIQIKEALKLSNEI